jgi:hypothetical protein
MRPFTNGAYVLRFLWDGVPMLVWLGVGLAVYRVIAQFVGTPPEINAPLTICAVAAVVWILRPVRKFFNMKAYYFMVLAPIKPLIELGVWKLLLVHDHYWHSEQPLYEGTLAFTTAYFQRKPEWQHKINQILWRAEMVGKSHVAKPSREFLREVNAPLQADLSE